MFDVSATGAPPNLRTLDRHIEPPFHHVLFVTEGDDPIVFLASRLTSTTAGGVAVNWTVTGASRNFVDDRPAGEARVRAALVAHDDLGGLFPNQSSSVAFEPKLEILEGPSDNLPPRGSS